MYSVDGSWTEKRAYVQSRTGENAACSVRREVCQAIADFLNNLPPGITPNDIILAFGCGKPHGNLPLPKFDNPTEVSIMLVIVDEIIDLRHRMLREGLPIETASFPGDNDPATHHFAVYLSYGGENIGSPIGCASFMWSPLGQEPAWQLRGMATETAYQGRGLGNRLLDCAEETLAQLSQVRTFWCNARASAVKFYEKNGWSCVSEVFDIPSAGPHREMVKRL